ncbi:SH3 domain-containing protein [Vibrio tapetis subsp. quintayensis]|uniref:SH3 domain-containing protein n=1 Tax=Vibrio tapetis TaxID=52443 RepID=UPI0025B2B8EF|nr:SH3 domain-containing protein [Vibrio tapetis]MDN3679219.1 SH3 domain-containing protein [Vibrio tapetis subsp. quintayensis]
MKKLLILIVILALAGGGAYYYFFIMMAEEVVEEPVKEMDAPITEGGIDLGAIMQKEETMKPGEYYVTSSSLNVRREPNSQGRISTVLDIGTKVDVLEVKEGWARISEYIEFVDGELAQWVSTDFLADEVPSNMAQVRSGRLEIKIKHSDDFMDHRDVFMSVSQKLIDTGQCTDDDFAQTKGWLVSTVFSERSVYYTYCGGLERDDKIYLDTETKEVFSQ